MLNFILNGLPFSTDEGINILELLKIKNINPQGIAIAINQEVIPKIDWENIMIHNNDNIIIITATAGG